MLRHLLKTAITRIMAVLVIDGFEMVDVNYHKRLVCPKLVWRFFHKPSSVRKPRKLIPCRLNIKTFLQIMQVPHNEQSNPTHGNSGKGCLKQAGPK